MTTPEDQRRLLLQLTAQIVTASITSAETRPAEIASLIASTYEALYATAQTTSGAPPRQTLRPAVPIKQSVTPDYIVCLEDGIRFKSMRSHLRKLGMTPDDYRAKWSLPADYPIVAPNYTASRSALALKSGLGVAGRKPKRIVATATIAGQD